MFPWRNWNFGEVLKYILLAKIQMSFVCNSGTFCVHSTQVKSDWNVWQQECDQKAEWAEYTKGSISKMSVSVPEDWYLDAVLPGRNSWVHTPPRKNFVCCAACCFRGCGSQTEPKGQLSQCSKHHKANTKSSSPHGTTQLPNVWNWTT